MQWSLKKLAQIDINLGSVSAVEIMLFTKHLSVALRSGVSLIEALEMLQEQSKGKMRSIIKDIRITVEGGYSFHQAISKYPKYFSSLYLNMVRSGELSGTLEENLTRLSVDLKKAILVLVSTSKKRLP